jgi:hypothetical protein
MRVVAGGILVLMLGLSACSNGTSHASTAATTSTAPSTTTSITSTTSTTTEAPATTTEAPATTTTTQAVLPTLGTAFEPNVQGYGEVRPTTINNNGDPTGTVTSITWDSWGGTQATGHGTSVYVGPNQSTAQGTEQPATVVAFDLGVCQGKAAYLGIEWFFPQQGQTFDPTTYRNTCTGDFVAPNS